MNRNIKKKSLGIVIAVIIFYAIILATSDIEKLSINLKELKFEYFGIIFLLIILRSFVFAIRFHVLLKKIGIRLNIKDSFRIYLAGMSMSITPGGMGSIIKSYILKKKASTTYSSTTPIIIFEKWLDITAICMIVGILLVWANFIESGIIVTLGAVFSSIIFIMMTRPESLGIINKIIQKISFLKKKTININEYQESINKLTKIKNIAILLPFSLIPKIITAGIIILIFESLNLNIAHVSAIQAFFTSQLLGFLSFVPGGFIVTETSLLAMLLNQGIDFSDASLLVLIIRFWTIWIITIIGFIFLKSVLKQSNIDDGDISNKKFE